MGRSTDSRLVTNVGATSYGGYRPKVLHRAILRLAANGTLLQRLVLANAAPAVHHQDGCMCVAVGPTPSNRFVVTGFIGGENSTAPGYPDEPMFLIKRGRAFVAEIGYSSDKMHVVREHILDDSAAGFRVYQGMRVVWDPVAHQYAVSHTVSYDDGGNIQMGMTAVGPWGTVRWMKAFPASVGGRDGHASHPYALALASADPGSGDEDNGGYAIGGLAVIMEPPERQIEQCQGRIVRVSRDGMILWDKRFGSKAPDANVECYGIQQTLDYGFIMTCGTGVEPELHPGNCGMYGSPPPKKFAVRNSSVLFGDCRR